MKDIRCVHVCGLEIKRALLFYRIQEERERKAQLRGPLKINRDEAAIKIQKVKRS